MKTEFYTQKRIRNQSLWGTIVIASFALILAVLLRSGKEISSTLMWFIVGPTSSYMLWSLYSHFMNSSSVIVDEDWIWIREPMDMKKIRWDEIVAFAEFNNDKERLLCLYLKDPKAHLKKLSVINRFLAKNEEEHLRTHVLIRETSIDNRLAELVKIVASKVPPINR